MLLVAMSLVRGDALGRAIAGAKRSIGYGRETVAAMSLS